MRKYIFLFFISFCVLPALAQNRFSEHTEVTMAGDTLEFGRFANKPILVYTAALWHEDALQYAELLQLQETYGELGFVLMELYSADMSDIDYLEREPFYLYNRSEYPPCRFTFPLFVYNNLCPFFRFLQQHTTPDKFVTTKDNEKIVSMELHKPLHKWIINKRGEVVKCFDSTVPIVEVVATLKEVMED